VGTVNHAIVVVVVVTQEIREPFIDSRQPPETV
jgi:hypothetical protein